MLVLIVDDHPLFAKSLEFVIRQTNPCAIVTCVHTLDDALLQLKKEKGFDIVLLDLMLAGENGLSLLTKFPTLNTATKFCVISAIEENAVIARALNSGASGFIPKSLDSSEVIKAIDTVISGGEYLPSSIKQDINDQLAETSLHSPQLTERQQEILTHMSRGKTNREIADELFISEVTVKSHLKSIFHVLDASNRMDCVYKAQKFGLLMTV